MTMKFPFVTRKTYDRLSACAQKLCADVIRLEDERDGVIGKAADLADIERKDREQERGHFEAILNNMRGAR
jgi:hypothetical protein